MRGGGFGAGRWGYGVGGSYTTYRRYSYTHAYVAASASLVRVGDGALLHATPAPMAARVRSTDEPQRLTDELLMHTAGVVADALVREFAVAPTVVKVNKGKALRTARRRADGQLKHTNDFRRDEEELLVVLRLPPEADRNDFRLVLARKKRDEPLAEERITWSRKDASLEFAFPIRALVEAGGTGDFDARLYLGEQLVLKRGFEIE